MIDWIATAGVLSSAYLLTKKNRWGTVTGAIGSGFWVVWFGFMQPETLWSAVFLNLAFIGININGYFRWKELNDSN